MKLRDLYEFTSDYARFDQRLMSPLGRRFLFSWRNRVTSTGRMLFLILLVSGPVSAVIGLTYPLYYYSVFLFSLLLVGRFGGIIFAPRVIVKRHLPERCAAGAEIDVHTEVVNESILGVFDLAISESMPHYNVEFGKQPLYIEYLPRGGSEAMSYKITMKKRGAYDFTGPVAMTAFPFGLYHHTRDFKAPCRMLVYPRFMPLTNIVLPVGRKHQPGGLQMVSHVGDSEEFLGNREYAPGDRLRDIDHMAWARAGFPIVREFQQEYLCRIALIVDTYVPSFYRRGDDDLEAALSLSAAIADVLSRREYVIDIFAAGPDLYHFQAGRSLAYLDNILDILACIDSCRTSPFEKLGPALMDEISKISTAVLVLLDWNEERERFVRSLREYGVAVKVFVVRTRKPAHDPAGFVTESGEIKWLTPENIEIGMDIL